MANKYKGAEHHTQAVEHLDHAARHHREAAKHHEAVLRGRYCVQSPKSCVDISAIGVAIRIPCSTAILKAVDRSQIWLC